ncbi:hypothetical protein EG329_008571 [Mollisiaceae sp. DMI_Dod_QoI]|nr:hypothetical protein EG329_008571 [Helotiales sp. DMI_Dod_QoI]
MSYNQVAIYKYGNQAQAVPVNSSVDVARQFVPKSRTLQNYKSMSSGPSRMPGNCENNGMQWSQERKREFANWRLQGERARVLADVFGGVPRDAEQEEYQEDLKNLAARGSESQNSYGTSRRQNSGDIQYKLAHIHNPTNGQVKEVTVVEDSACRVNFVSPAVARLCNLTIYSTSEIEHATLMGSFTSDQWTEVNWVGKSGITGSNYFYLAPEGAPIDVLVGTEFLRDHPDKKENSQIEANEEIAGGKAAELENKRKQAKQHQGQQKQKQAGSSSRSSRSKKT